MSARASAALLLLSAACASAPAPPAAPRARRAWPDPPQAARVRWQGAFPDPDRPAPERSFWARALHAETGEAERDRPAPVLVRPFGVAVAGGGFVVADPDLRRVLRVAWPGGAAEEVTCAGREWAMPMAVAAGPDGTLYVADGAGGRVVAVPREGLCRALGEGVLERPTGVALAGGKVWVVDPPRHAVHAFDPAGAHLLAFGVRGDGGGAELNFPTAIAAAPDGSLLVVDALNFRVARFGADGSARGSFGGAGDGGGAFGRPKAVAVDGQGRIFVTDARLDFVLVFGPGGGFELAFGGSGGGPGDLSLPAGVAVGGGRLYVADSYNHRVEIYELVEGTP